MSRGPEIVNILGEQVSLSGSEFPSSEKFLVSFDEKYKYPGMTTSEEAQLKKTFVLLFSGSSSFLPAKQNPAPPCTDSEKNLVIKSLSHRFSSLRNEVIAERQSQSDSLRLRQIMDHLQRLKDYIDFAKTTEECQQVDEGILAESLGNLSDEEIQQLLKQFVFFILQGQHPLPDFVGRDPNPKGFVARLHRKPIQDFDTFMKDYRDKKYPIPVPIEHVLKGAQLNLQAFKGQLDKAIQEKLKTIFVLLSDTLPTNDPFWKDLDRNNLEAIVQKLLETVQQLRADLAASQDDAQQLEAFMLGMKEELEALREEKKTLLEKLRLLQEELNSLKKRSNQSGLNQEQVEEEAERMIDGLEGQIRELEQRIQSEEAKRKECETKLAALEQSCAEKDSRLAALQGMDTQVKQLQETVSKLQAELTAANEKASAVDELQRRVKTLEQQVKQKEDQLADLRQHAGKLTLDIDAFLQEKAELLARIKQLEEEIEVLEALLGKLETLQRSLTQDQNIVATLLGDIQRDRSQYASTNDPILQKISDVKQSSNTVDPNLGSKVTEILQLVQEELSQKQKELEGLRGELDAVLKKISNAEGNMTRSNEILAYLRAGREDLVSKGFEYQYEEELLEDGFRALQAEKELKEAQAALQVEADVLSAKNQELVKEMEGLQAKFQAEIDGLEEQLRSQGEELEGERKKSASLLENISTLEVAKGALETQVNEANANLQKAETDLEELRAQSEEKIRAIEEQKLKECEQRLAELRAEEEKKRAALLGTEGQEKDQLQAQIADLLKRMTTIEGERDAYKAELDLEKEALARKEEEFQEVIERERETLEKLDKMEQTLAQKEQAITGLEQDVAVKETEKAGLQVELQAKDGEIEVLTASLEKERSDASKKLQELEERKLRECEERLAALRKEEEAKRKELADSKGLEKGSLEAKIKELLDKVSKVEAERDSIAGEIQKQKAVIQLKDDEIAKLKASLVASGQKLSEQEARAIKTKDELTGILSQVEAISMDQVQMIEDLRGRIMSDTTEKAALYEILTNVANWISSKGTDEMPPIDQGLDRKYGIHRILDAFLTTLGEEEGESKESSALSSAMSRCYLVFFMSYVYARHFPAKFDKDEYNYQSLLTSFFSNAIKNIYSVLDAGIPGKLEKIGSQVPVQLKSKYVMNILLPLVKQMELVHEKGAKGADFLKFSTLDQDQLATLYSIHAILKDQIRLNKDIQTTATKYFARHSGHLDSDINNLYLRFYYEERTKREFPVIMYIKPDAAEVPKFTFASDLDFSKYLSAPLKEATEKVSPAAASALKKDPVFSFTMLFYLFLFIVKDYLSSVEGELDKAGCPLPQILKPAVKRPSI